MKRSNKLGNPPSRRPGRPSSLTEVARDLIGDREGPILVVGSRVGTVEEVPPNYHPAPCLRCGRMVWANGELLLSFDVIAVCTVCVPT